MGVFAVVKSLFAWHIGIYFFMQSTLLSEDSEVDFFQMVLRRPCNLGDMQLPGSPQQRDHGELTLALKYLRINTSIQRWHLSMPSPVHWPMKWLPEGWKVWTSCVFAEEWRIRYGWVWSLNDSHFGQVTYPYDMGVGLDDFRILTSSHSSWV